MSTERSEPSDGRKVVGMIDLTPTWRGVMPIYLEAYHNGTTPQSRAAAYEELQRIADLADAYVAEHKPKKG